MARRCALCPNKNACIGPDGPEQARILIVGEAPGRDEQIKGRVFVGRTGRELDDHYLPLAGLRRSDVLITNAISCLPITPGGKLNTSRAKDMELLECCALTNIYPLIVKGNFQLIVPMGAFACRAVIGDVNLELQHGIPAASFWGTPAFPQYHPALGMHSPKKMLDIRTDWLRLREYLGGRLVIAEDDYPDPDYAEVTDVDEIHALDVTQPMACDTETSPSVGPYFLTYSVTPGTGRLIRVSRPDLLVALQSKLDTWESIILFHHWLYDARIVSGMGLSFPAQRLADTMVNAYHLGNLPQALKTLAYRELGMVMQDFEDLVIPYSTELALAYLERARDIEWGKPEHEMYYEPKEQLWKVKKPQGLNTKLKRFFTDFSKNEDKDVFGAWENWADMHVTVTNELGPFPQPDIAHVEFSRALHYACRDADATLRLNRVMNNMKNNVHRGLPQEKWRS